MSVLAFENTPWDKVRFEEMLRILELNKETGERRIREFQERRAAVKQRQGFLQQRRIARLRMEGIVIDLDAVRRRCKASKESIWYEEVSDEEEKQKLMKKRLKEMFKKQSSQPQIKERVESISSEEEPTVKEKEKPKEEEKPQRGQVLRNYTKMYGVTQEKLKEADKLKGAQSNQETAANKNLDKGKEVQATKEEVANEKQTTTSNATAVAEKDIPKPQVSQNVISTSTTVVTKGALTKSRNGGPMAPERKFGAQRFQRAVTKVTTVNRLGEGPGRQSISPIVQKLNTRSRMSRNASESDSGSPGLPRINSAVSRK